MGHLPIAIRDEESFRNQVLSHPGPAAVVFETEWSGASQILAPIVDRVAAEVGPGTPVYRVNVDECPWVVAACALRQVPAVLLYADGRIVDRLLGAVPGDTLLAAIQALERAMKRETLE